MGSTYNPEFGSGSGAGRARESQADTRSTIEIIKDVIESVREIIRSEIRLARAEATEKAVEAGKGAGVLVAGAVIALYAFAFVLVSVYVALSNAIAPWLSALLIGIVLGIAAYPLISKGRTKIKRLTLRPERAMESVREDVRTVKEHTR
jgi:hypothetical protein